MTIYINTNQNVNIEYEICSIGKRIGAYLIDGLVLAGMTLVIVFIAGAISFGTENYLYFFLIILPTFFYHLVCELTMEGQSIGKRSMKIRVIKADGTPASFSNYFLRFLLRPIDSIYALGLAFIFFTKKGQRLGDLAAGTVVVNIKEAVTMKDIKAAMNVSQAEIIYKEVALLKDKDIAVIRKVLEQRKKEPNHENVLLLANKIQKHLHITTDKKPYTFLRIIVRDYNSMFS